MPHRKTERNPLFAGRWFEDDIILLCLRWYFRFKLSCREVAAKAFFRKALKHHREPHSITLDGHQPSHSALRRMGMNGEFNFRGRNPVKMRCCQYLNNVVEQDHRRVKGRVRPMLVLSVAPAAPTIP